MYGFRDLADKTKRYYKYSVDELKGLIISILVLAFIVSFKEWGYGDNFNAIVGLKNLFIAIILITITILIHDGAQRISALHSGFRIEYKMWWYGLLIGLILVFISKGNIWFLAPGGILFHHMATHRLGFFRYGVNIRSVGLITLIGPIANIIFATLIKVSQVNLHLFSVDNIILNKIFLINWVFAVWNLLPIPPLDGVKVFQFSRLTYVALFGFIAGYVALIKFLGVYSYIIALAVAAVVWFAYYIGFERKVI